MTVVVNNRHFSRMLVIQLLCSFCLQQMCIRDRSYPTEKYQVNACTSIIDGKLYLESLISMISKNWENPTFHPTIEQLWEYRETVSYTHLECEDYSV